LPTPVRHQSADPRFFVLTLATAMDTDKVKVFGARFKVDGTGKLAELERAERVRSSTSCLVLLNQESFCRKK
jgi:hypothetical protein